MANSIGRTLKIIAAVALAAALFLPLCSFVGGSTGELAGSSDRDYRYAWQLIDEDWSFSIPLALAFLWPLPVFALYRIFSEKRRWVPVAIEALLIIASSLIVLALPQVIFEYRRIIWLWFMLVGARAEVGYYLALAANGLYAAGWLAHILLKTQNMYVRPAISH